MTTKLERWREMARQRLEEMWKRLEELQDVLKRGDYHPDAEARIQNEIQRLQNSLSPAEAETSLYLRGRPEALGEARREATVAREVRVQWERRGIRK